MEMIMFSIQKLSSKAQKLQFLPKGNEFRNLNFKKISLKLKLRMMRLFEIKSRQQNRLKVIQS